MPLLLGRGGGNKDANSKTKKRNSYKLGDESKGCRLGICFKNI